MKERIEFTKIENEPYFRLMRPMVTEKGCLKCHGFQGYKVGDIRGGVSVSIPLSLYLQRERKELMQYTLTHILLWILGIGGIFFIFQGLKKSITERKWAEVKIINEKEPVKVSLIVREALKLLRPSLPSTIKIRQRIIADRDVILADPTQIHQVLMNLCTNALHAMFIGGGVLEVQLSDMEFDAESAVYYEGLEPGSYIKLEVSDTGHGMNREVMDKIFDPKADCHA